MIRESFDGSAPMMDSIAQRVATRYKQALVIPREYHLPPDARGSAPFQPEGTDLFIWTWEKTIDTPLKGPVTRYYGIAFAGKSNKPLWNYIFRSEESRQKEIDRSIAARKSILKMKQERVDERRNYQHDYKEGDFLYSSWGYEQTNVNFYQVVGDLGKMIVVREVATKVVDENKNITHVVPVSNKFIGPALKRKVGVGGYVKIDNVQNAHKWDGKPVYETSSGWGH